MVGLVNGIRTLKDFKTDRRLSAGFNTAQLTGTATIYVMVGQEVWQSTQIVDTNPSAACTFPPPVITSFSFGGSCVDPLITWASTGGTFAVLEHLRNNIVISSVSVPTSGSIGGVQLNPITECEDVLTLVVTGPGGTATQTIDLR
jgi:hypothetical protein